jgi:TolA-binding protein
MKKISLPILLLGLLALTSCGIDNTMYNAKKYFKDAQARPLNANGKPTPQAVDEYTKAIKKCGIILTNKKDSKAADDALYLMARALYYKGNSAFQAKDQFEALIKGFPDSPFVPEAHIYLARVLREINRPADAEKGLEEFVRDARFVKQHPRALLTLAEFQIGDKDYLRAQYWLERIITDYPKSKEYREAFFLFGKNYYIQKDYTASLNEFNKLAESRKIPKELKLDARYYIALNQFELGKYEQSLKTVQKLLNDEMRPEKLAQAKVLKARLLFATGEGKKGEEEIDALSKATPRTAASAEAFYRLGDYQFYQKQDMAGAQTSYNKVRTEFALSEFVDAAQRKSNAINQLKLTQKLDPEGNFQQFVDYYTIAAENYLSPFALPDSALICYQRLIDAKTGIQEASDSLAAVILTRQSEIDSLSALLEVENPVPGEENDKKAVEESLLPVVEGQDSLAIEATVVPDSLETEVPEPIGDEAVPSDSLQAEKMEEPAPPDSLFKGEKAILDVSEAIPDTLMPVLETEGEISVAEVVADIPDNLAIETVASVMEECATADSLRPEILEQPSLQDSLSTEEVRITEEPAEPQDSLAVAQQEQYKDLQTRISNLEAGLSGLRTRQTNLEALLSRFDTEVLPLALFAQASIYKKVAPDPERFEETSETLTRDYPESKYANAIEAMREGEPIRLIDPAEEADEHKLDHALGLAEAAPDSMLAILEDLTASKYSPIRLRANFRLGWYNVFDQPDTTKARPYLEEVLQLEQTGDYTSFTQRIFNGTRFTFMDKKAEPDTLSALDSLLVNETGADSLAVPDSLGVTETSALPDSLDAKTMPDSLFEAADSLSAADSTAVVPQETEEEPAPGPSLDPDSPSGQEAEPVEKKEDPPPGDEAPQESPPLPQTDNVPLE